MVQVVVDGRALYNQHSRDRGIGRYVRQLLPVLGRQRDMRTSVLAVAGTGLPAEVSMVPVRRWVPERSPVLSYTIERLSLWEHLARLPGEIGRSGADVFHSPATEPPRRCPLPWVQTIHDVIPLALAAEDPVAAELWRERMAPAATADAVIADSRLTAEDAVRLLGVDSNRVHIVPLGVDPMFHPPKRSTAGRGAYILYVGQWGPNKGYAEAFQVISRLAEAGHPHVLRVVGRIRQDVRSRVEALVAESGRPDRVELCGFVSEDRLVSLYQGAAATIITSRYEGFGLPALEAMATGTPVVAFRNSSLAEVVGEGGLLVDDGDVAAMVAALEPLLDDPNHWRRLSEAGIVRARSFTWEACARRHVEIFASVARSA